MDIGKEARSRELDLIRAAVRSDEFNQKHPPIKFCDIVEYYRSYLPPGVSPTKEDIRYGVVLRVLPEQIIGTTCGAKLTLLEERTVVASLLKEHEPTLMSDLKDAKVVKAIPPEWLIGGLFKTEVAEHLTLHLKVTQDIKDKIQIAALMVLTGTPEQVFEGAKCAGLIDYSLEKTEENIDKVFSLIHEMKKSIGVN